MVTATQIYTSLGVSPDPDVVVALDAQFDKLDNVLHTSRLVVTGVSTTLYAKFGPGTNGPTGSALFDKPGVDLFHSVDLPIPKLSPGVYKLEILRERDAILYKGEERLWSGTSLKAFNNLAGIHEVAFN